MLEYAVDGARAALAVLGRAVQEQFASAVVSAGTGVLPLELERLFQDTCTDMSRAFYEVSRKYDGMDDGASGYVRKSIFEARMDDARLVGGLALVIATLRVLRERAGCEDIPLSGIFWLFAGHAGDASGLGSELGVAELRKFASVVPGYAETLLGLEVDFVVANADDEDFIHGVQDALVARLAGIMD